MDYVLFTDSDCDITPELAKQYGYKRIISMPYSIDGKTIYPYEDFDTFDVHTFYQGLRDGILPTTSAVGVQKYIEYFEPEFKEGNDILYVHFSNAMSMTFSNMDQALGTLKEKYPERKFYRIDTKGITSLAAAICLDIGELYKQGKGAQEIVDLYRTEVDRYAMYLFTDNLKFFKRSGRVSGLTATMGSIIGIKPLIYMSKEGKMDSYGTARGRRRAIEAIVGKIMELGDHVAEHRIVIGHTDAPTLVEETISCIKEKLGDDLDIMVIPANPTSGSHSGPDGLAVCFRAKSRE